MSSSESRREFERLPPAMTSEACLVRNRARILVAELDKEIEQLKAQQGFNADWERMYCATGHERISFIGETCPLCAERKESKRLQVGWDCAELAVLALKLRLNRVEQGILRIALDELAGGISEHSARDITPDEVLGQLVERLRKEGREKKERGEL